jgi:hypothetical protein
MADDPVTTKPTIFASAIARLAAMATKMLFREEAKELRSKPEFDMQLTSTYVTHAVKRAKLVDTLGANDQGTRRISIAVVGPQGAGRPLLA